MSNDPLESLADYSRFVAELLDCPSVEHSTVAVWSDSPYTGIVEGEIFLSNGIRLRLTSFTQPNLPFLVREAEKLAEL